MAMVNVNMIGVKVCIIASFVLIQTGLLVLWSTNSMAFTRDSTQLHIDPAVDDRVKVYPRAFFSRFNPQTALDMSDLHPK